MEAKNPFLEPNKVVAFIAYFILSFIGGSIIIIITANLYNKINNLYFDSFTLLEIISEIDINKLTEIEKKLYVFCNSFGNFFMYLLLFIVVCFYMRNYLIEDALKLKQNYKKYLWLIPLTIILGYLISYFIEMLVSNMINNTSINQSSIETLIKNGGAVMMFFSVVVFAPIVEELIYRKAIFEFLKKKHIIVSYIISVIIFMLPHMLTTFMEIGYNTLDKLLLCIPYLSSGLILCAIYHVNNKNIYASWLFHIFNNLISFIIIIII